MKFTTEQIRSYIDQLGIGSDPMSLYAQATKYAVTGNEIDAAMGWGEGSFDHWVKVQGFEPLSGSTGLAGDI